MILFPPPIEAKFTRAQEFIIELAAAEAEYRASRPISVGHRIDPINGRVEYFIESVQPIPDQLPVVLGDALNQLVSSLDHVATHLVERTGHVSASRPKRVQFPIVGSEQDFDRKVTLMMPDVPASTISAIRSLTPWKGASDLWTLKEANNESKHRNLLHVEHGKAGLDVLSLRGIREATARHLRIPLDQVQLPGLSFFTGAAAVAEAGTWIFSTSVDEPPDDGVQCDCWLAVEVSRAGTRVELATQVKRWLAAMNRAVRVLAPLV